MSFAQSFLHLLVPRHTNNHRAKILHTSSIVVLCMSLVVVQVTLTVLDQLHKPATSNVLGYALQISKEEIIKLTNLKRQENGLSPLKENSSLSSGALAKGQNMLSVGYWAHIAPDGTTPWKFFGDVGYKYRYAGENLARDFSSADATVNAWMASPSHRDNMLSPKYTEIGIGIVEGDLAGSDSTIIVQFFGSPLRTANTQTVEAPLETVNVVPSATPIAIAFAQTPEPSSLPLATPPTLVAGTEQSSPFSITKLLSVALVAVLAIAFVIDLFVISRKRISRNSGRSIAHLAFLGMTLGVVLIIQAGQIL